MAAFRWFFLLNLVLLVSCGGDSSSEPPDCEVGQSGTDCAPCPAGTYCPGGAIEARPCSDGAWDHDAEPATECVAWQICETFQYVAESGTRTTDRACADWTPCEPGEYVVAAATATKNWVCETCGAGTFSTGSNAESCVEWTTCEDGEYVLESGSHTHDVLCGECEGAFWSVGPNAPSCGLSPILEVSTAEQHTCAIRVSDHNLVCWGYDRDGRSSPPTGGFKTISAGAKDTCAIRAGSHELACWGSNDNDFLRKVPLFEGFRAVDVGVETACAIRESDSKLRCWGALLGLGEPQSAVEKVSLAPFHACVILAADKSIYCWGDDSQGVVSRRPTSGEFVDISASREHNCAVRSDGVIKCWGSSLSESVIQVPPDDGYSEVVASQLGSCALRDQDGQVICWGGAASHEGAFAHIVRGTNNLCGLLREDSSLICWGTEESFKTTGGPSVETFQQLSAGSFQFCALDSLGKMFCAGSRTLDEDIIWDNLSAGNLLTCGVTAEQDIRCFDVDGLEPLNVPDGAFTKVSVGYDFVCGIQVIDQSLLCWGWDGNGQISLAPTGPFVDVSAGRGVSCALKASGEAVCWGFEPFVPLGTFWSSITSGIEHSCGIANESGLPTCWRGFSPAIPAPVDAISAGDDHVCAIRSSDKRLLCWGEDDEGQVSEAPEGGFLEVQSGRKYTCARRVDGSMTCWGIYRFNPR